MSRDLKLTPLVLWMTGLSGSGKTTLSLALVEKLKAQFVPVLHLDGDIIRDNKTVKLGFSESDRRQHIIEVGKLAASAEKKGKFVIVSLISPYKESRDIVRSLCHIFVELYVSTPLIECEKRDPKGLYNKVRKNEISQFTGIDSPFEPPLNPEIEIDTSQYSLEECVEQVMSQLQEIFFEVSKVASK